MDETTVEPSVAHALFGLGFCQKWIGTLEFVVTHFLSRFSYHNSSIFADFAGRNRITYGKIGHAIDSSDTTIETTFEMTYYGDDDIVDEVVPPPLRDTVTEKVVWSGHMAYISSVDPQKVHAEASQIPFHVKWITADFRKYDDLGALILKLRGFRLYLSPQESTMPGAGIGLFLSVKDVSGASRSHFVLPQGELLCLGPYGPCRLNDFKAMHVFEVKSFIHEFEPESYCFESKNMFIDLTDDRTGELHSLAASSLMCRVNETDGNDIPCVCAERDPSGSIQYFLGHGIEGQGDLSIPVDTPMELKVCCLPIISCSVDNLCSVRFQLNICIISLFQIDYGDLYERQRVRCNYPRIKGRELGNTLRSIELSDKDAIKDFSLYTPTEIHDCLLFLESLFCPTWSTDIVKLQRSLIVSLALRRRRLATQVDSFDDMDQHNTLKRSNVIVKSICDSIGQGEKFRQGVLSCDLLKSAIVELFGGMDVATIEALPTAILYNKIVSGN